MKYVAFQAVLLSAVLVHFGAETVFAQQAVLYDFTATWCGPCQQVAPIVHKLQREGLPVQQVDIDKNPKLAKQFRVTSIPAFVLVVNGKEVKRILGGQTTEQDLRRLLSMIPAKKTNQQSVIAGGPGQNRTPGRRPNTGYETPNLGTASAFPSSFGKQQPSQPKQFANANQPAPPMPNVSAQQPMQKTAPAFANSLANNRDAKETPVIRAQLDQSSNVTKPTPHVDSSAANVRIRIKDESGINYGSGTIIHSTPGVSYILTCGHIFRNLTDSSKVDVDIFTGDRFESYLGKVEKYDLDADVGLISIPTDGVLPVARLASSGSQIPKGDSVISVGCSGGQPPTTQNLSVTAINRYTGPDNVECTGVPVQGRSGGGLFNLENEVVGVCIAADPKEKRGLYAGLQPVLDLVESCGLESIVRKPQPISQPAESLVAANTDNAFGVPMQEPPVAVPAGSPIGYDPNNGSASNQNPQAVAQMLNSLQFANGAKLTIVIESPDAPGQTRVVIIPSATPRLIADLTGELNKTQNVSAHRRMISQTNRSQTMPVNTNTVAPMRTVSREEDRSMTMPTGFSAAQPYRRVRR